MKKGYYLYIDNLKGSSLTNKIRMQMKTFGEVFSIEECVLKTVKKPFIIRLTNILPFCSYSRDYDNALKSISVPDFLYIRMLYADKAYFSFLAEVKRSFSNCRIIVEIPTYPYKKEWCANLYGRFMYLKDILFREKYKRYIDRFVTFSYDETINGVTTIRTMNGVDVEAISPVAFDREYDPKCINLIAVAFLMRHHGYERVIEGMREYYKSSTDRKVYITIIGDGSEKKKYERLVKKYNLSEYIRLPGPMYGQELDEMYKNVDAGLAGFGFYKDGIEQVGTLKTREYLAKGLPVILGTDDKVFNNINNSYGLVFPNDDSPVDIKKVISFLDRLYLGKKKSDVIGSIREFAKRTVDNRMTLAPIIDYIKNS